MTAFLRALRPHQWTKNLLVFAALLFSKHLFEPEPFLRTFLAFVAFSATPGTEAKMFATALGGGILIDATIVRLVLVPATMKLLGDANWWLPDWMGRVLPTFDVEGRREHPQPHAPVPAGIVA